MVEAMRPRVSVIIPVRNGAGTIARAIDSALAQDYDGGFEVVVANDGSTDCTAEILSRYGDRIALVTLEPSGVSAARNAAVNVARGEYIAFLDADDEWLPEKLARTVPVLDRHPECVLVHHDAIGVDVAGRVCAETCAAPPPASGPSQEQLADGFCPLTSCTVMRREVYQRCGGSREDLDRMQDKFLYMMARELGSFSFLPARLARYQWALPPTKEERCLEAGSILTRLIRERYGFEIDYVTPILVDSALVHMARGEPGFARKRYFAVLRANPLNLKAYLRLLWTFIPPSFASMLRAIMPARYYRKLNGPPEGFVSAISY